jgi:hypothetical protein
MQPPFLRPDHRDYSEILTDGTIQVLGAHGIDRWSVRALARWMRVVPATLLNDYSRARVLAIVIICFERRWLAWSGSEPMYGSSPTHVPLRLPESEDEHLGVRVLTSLQLLAEAERLRGNGAPTTHLHRLRKEEEALLRHRLRILAERHGSAMPSEPAVTATMALITGLRLALAEPTAPITFATARDLLATHVARLFDDAGPDHGQVAS